MATSFLAQHANSPSPKRSFCPDPSTTSSSRGRTSAPPVPKVPYRFLQPTASTTAAHPSARQRHRGYNSESTHSSNTKPSMPTQANARLAAPMPTFMSVFGEEINREGAVALSARPAADTLRRPATAGNILRSPIGSTNPPFSIFHQHRDSTSTSASESTDSSPTTTISTLDSASMTEPSPGASPESPATKASPSSFVPDFRSRSVGGTAESGQAPFFELQRPTTPAKKGRNLKNLAVNTSSSLSLNRPASSAALHTLHNKAESTTSAPVSPSFVKPPTPPKRRPSNLALTLQTPGNGLLPTRLTIPPTPSFKRPSLRHFQSSPSLPLCSPSVIPEPGAQPPAQPQRTFKASPHGFAEIPFEDEEEEQEPNFDIPQSREEKPAAYPNGPICIYESGVWLYYEPTAEQASNYDVILNVASEVKNPFSTTVDEAAAQVSERMEIDAGRSRSEPASTVDPVPADFAATALANAADANNEQAITPTTPKASAGTERQGSKQPFSLATTQNLPEYIHIPWEHNTDIVPDLYKLVKIIEDRVQKRKRVLVHCQCGVSRSASLIVAYGLYKNPGITVQEAYDAVKKRSKWIGPNMNLIMQLQEFRNGLLRANTDRAFHNQVYGNRKSLSILSPAASAEGRRNSPFEADSSSGSRTPRTAPLPPDTSLDTTNQRASTGNMEALSAGPFPAPWSPPFRRSWASSQTNFDLSPRTTSSAAATETPLIDANGHLVPVPSPAQNGIAPSNNERVDSGTSESIDSRLKGTFSQPHSDSVTPADQSTQSDGSPRPDRPLSKVPNFSRRQLPLRLDNFDDAPKERSGPPLLSPRSEEFHMTPVRKEEYEDAYGILSPHRTTFNIAVHAPAPEESLKSPTFGSFPRDPFMHNPTPLRPFNREEDLGLMSPSLGGGFPKDPFSLAPPPSRSAQSTEAFGLKSPALGGGFPKDPFRGPPTPVASNFTSPREEEFHMTALQSVDSEEESFGLTSPRESEDFRRPVFNDLLSSESLKKERHTTLPQHVHPILPPPSDSRPSLDSLLVQHADIALAPAPSKQEESAESSNTTPTPGQPFPPPTVETTAEPAIRVTPQKKQLSLQLSASRPTPSPPKSSPRSTYLTTPPRQSLRSRFSSPNMSQQRRLHKLQTEIESKLLPGRSPSRGPSGQSQDDLDALMSPRATEFTKNPFHVDLPVETPSRKSMTFDFGFTPGSTVATDKDMNWTPGAGSKDDPRSPVLTGSSPIVRNIWDVL